MRSLRLLLLPALLSTVHGLSWPDPNVRTSGEVWPMPLEILQTGDSFAFNPKLIKYTNPLPNCDIIQSALAGFGRRMDLAVAHSATNKGFPVNFVITVKDNACPTAEPEMGMAEGYNLDVSMLSINLVADQVWGVIRGLETLTQLTQYTADGLKMRTVSVKDAPRFPHRGLLLDTARHFHPVPTIKALIELLAMNKMNVFHWHISDNEAFPLAPASYPDLAKGAYDATHLYTVKDVKDIVAFARLRGVRVIPELDSPGHAQAIGRGIPSLVNRCFDKGVETNVRAMLDPTTPKTFDVLKGLFKELFTLFPEGFFHLGGDEVEIWMNQCWANNPNVTAFMQKNGFKTMRDLEQYYFNQLLAKITQSDMPKKKFLVWQEVLDMGVTLDGVIAHVWKGNTYQDQMNEMAMVVKAGHLAILSSCWYLDHISWTTMNHNDYKDYYACDPQDLTGVTDEELARVMGGEVAMWGEMVDSTIAIQRIFPRSCAIAEKLWSGRQFTKSTSGSEVWPRLLEWQCRMKERGFPVEPGNGPGYCPFEYSPALPDMNY